MTMDTTDTPTRFEDEFPEEAAILMDLCSDKELRERTQWDESSLPREERLYPHINDLELGKLGWKYMDFMTPEDKSRYQIFTNKVGRNEPCPCGSGKKFKKCCINS
jgi:uncharacterized protein YecA (UPF0149 family)